MDLLGIGPLEILFVLLIAFLILGPKNIEKTGKSLGKLLRSINNSESWEAVKSVTSEIKNLPRTLMREAAIEDFKIEQAEAGKTIAPPLSSEAKPKTPEEPEAGYKAWTTPPEAEEETE